MYMYLDMHAFCVFEMEYTFSCTIYNYIVLEGIQGIFIDVRDLFSRARRKLQEVFSQDDGLNIGMFCYISNLCSKGTVHSQWSLGEQEMLWEHEPQAIVSTTFLSSSKLSWVFLRLDRKTESLFSISVTKQRNEKRKITCLLWLLECKLSLLVPSLRQPLVLMCV